MKSNPRSDKNISNPKSRLWTKWLKDKGLEESSEKVSDNKRAVFLFHLLFFFIQVHFCDKNTDLVLFVKWSLTARMIESGRWTHVAILKQETSSQHIQNDRK